MDKKEALKIVQKNGLELKKIDRLIFYLVYQQ